MTTLFYILMVLAPVALFATAFIAVKNRFSGKSIKKPLKMNIAVFAVLVVLISVLCVNVFAAEEPSASSSDAATTSVATVPTKTDNSKGLGLLAAGLVTGLAGIGGGLAIAAAAPAAIAATSEDPKSFGKSLIFVALGESIALFGVVISILILNKV